MKDKSNSSLSFTAPEVYKNAKGLVLIPSLSLGRLFRKKALENELTLQDAPPLADYIQGTVIKVKDQNSQKKSQNNYGEHVILLSPFMGGATISYLLSLILKNSKIKKIFFLGSAAYIMDGKSNDKVQCDIIMPSNFVTEGELEQSNNQNYSDNSITALSISNPLVENIDYVENLKSAFHISLIDMESAYIDKVCKKYGTEFFCRLIISDIWDITSRLHSQGRSLSKFQHSETEIDKMIQQLRSELTI